MNGDPRSELEQELMAFLDGELGAGASARWRRRLAADAELRRRATELSALDDALEQRSFAPVPHGLAARLAQRIGAPRPSRPRWRWPLLAGAAAAAVLLYAWLPSGSPDGAASRWELPPHLVPPPLLEHAEELDRAWREVQLVEREWGL